MICGHCKHTGVGVEHVRQCSQLPNELEFAGSIPSSAPARAEFATVAPASGESLFDEPVAKPAGGITPAQAKYMRTLREERGIEDLPFQGTKWEASAEIDRLKKLPRTAPANTPRPAQRQLEDGHYKLGDDIYRVVHNQAKTHQYASKLEIYTGDDGNNKGRWVYQAGAMKQIQPGQRLTPEQASEFGHLYGVCAVCGRALSVPESVDRGIGPICYAKMTGDL